MAYHGRLPDHYRIFIRKVHGCFSYNNQHTAITYHQHCIVFEANITEYIQRGDVYAECRHNNIPFDNTVTAYCPSEDHTAYILRQNGPEERPEARAPLP